jgi:hydroxymethylbilane synthase
VETRLARLRSGEFDALVLAAAGLDRLGIEITPAARLPFEVMLPAPAQGALAIQVRAGDVALRRALAAIEHRPTRIAVEAERMLLQRVGGGCLAPLGAIGQVVGATLTLRAAFESSEGSLARAEATGPMTRPATVVAEVARRISGATVTA